MKHRQVCLINSGGAADAAAPLIGLEISLCKQLYNEDQEFLLLLPSHTPQNSFFVVIIFARRPFSSLTVALLISYFDRLTVLCSLCCPF